MQTGREEKEVNFTCSEVHFFFLSANCYEGPSLQAEEKEEVHISSVFLQKALRGRIKYKVNGIRCKLPSMSVRSIEEQSSSIRCKCTAAKGKEAHISETLYQCTSV